MKRVLSFVLSLALLCGSVVCLTALPAVAVESYSVTAEKGGTVKYEDGVAEAVSYYGNTFKGWYTEGGALVSSEPVINSVSQNMVAKFNGYNLIDDGDFESGSAATADIYNAYSYAKLGKNNSVVSLPKADLVHGNKALLVEPEDSNTASDYLTTSRLLAIPVSLEEGKTYAFHLSYYVPETPVYKNGTTTDLAAWSQVGMQFLWNDFSEYTIAWANEANPTFKTGRWAARYVGSGTKTVNTRVNWAAYGYDKWGVDDLWIDVWVYFTADKTTDDYFEFGLPASTDGYFYVDNISLTEAVSAQNTAIKAEATAGGKTSPAQKNPLPVYTVKGTDGETSDVPGTTVAGTTAYSNIAISTYTATADDGYKFIGWYDSDDNLISKNATETFKAEGTYTAKFSRGLSCGEGGYLVENENDYVTATALYGNAFLGWFDGDTLVSKDPRMLNDGTVKYNAKFGVYNQIPDGDFNQGTGVDFWKDNWVAAMTLTESFGMNDDTGMKATTVSDAMLAVRVPVTVEKNKTYVASYNMKVNSYEATGTNSPVFGMMITATPDGTNGWGKWPKLARWNITVRNAEDPSKYVFYERVGYEQCRQILFSDVEEACGTGWLTVTLEFSMGEDTTNGTNGNLFENSDSAKIWLGLSTNKAKTDINYDNFSFYEKTAEVVYEGRENVRVERTDIGPVAEGVPYSFKLAKDDATNVTSVKFNGNDITAQDGVYSVVLEKENKISVTTDNDAGYTEAGKDFDGNDLTTYSYELYNVPLWEGDTVYQESIIFYPGRTEAKLLYPIDEIVSVRSYDMKTHYVKGVDFDVVDGKFVLLDGTRIPTFSTPTVLNSDHPDYGGSNHAASDDTGVKVGYYWAYDSYSYYVHVTYKHSEKWADRGEEGYTGKKQESLLSEMPEVAQKLANGEDVHIVFYGDSMTSGMSASGGFDYTYDEANDGTYDTGGWYVAPFVPNWMTIFIEGLRAEYPDSNITWENLSSIGKTADWGDQNIAARWALLEKEPDLFLIGWGINDNGQGVATASYKESIESIINKVKSYKSDTSIMLYGGSGVNDYIKKYDWTTLRSFAAALKELGAKYDNVAATDFTEIFMDFATGLETCDIFADNTVHANDFGGRIYSGVMLAALKAEDEPTPPAPTTPTAVTSKKYTVGSNTVSKITAGTTVSTLLSGINEGAYCAVYKGNTKLSAKDVVGTGMLVKIMDGNTVKATYTIIVTGDTNGDGAISVTDMIAVKAHILKKSTLSGAAAIAADTNGDNGISITDFIRIKASILKKGTITAR